MKEKELPTSDVTEIKSIHFHHSTTSVSSKSIVSSLCEKPTIIKDRLTQETRQRWTRFNRLKRQRPKSTSSSLMIIWTWITSLYLSIDNQWILIVLFLHRQWYVVEKLEMNLSFWKFFMDTQRFCWYSCSIDFNDLIVDRTLIRRKNCKTNSLIKFLIWCSRVSLESWQV